MKILIFLLIPLFTIANNIELLTKQIENKELIMILNDGKMQDLNEQSTDFKKYLHLKLYSVGINKSMYETEMIGSFHYYLAVSEYDEWPDQTVYYLGELGEIINIEWLEEKTYDKAKLKLTIVNYPSWVLEVDPKLKPIKKDVVLSITVDNLDIIEN